MLRRPDDVRDLHGGVINHGGEVVECSPIRPQDYRIAQEIGLPLDVAADQVVDGDGAAERYLEAESCGPLLDEPLAFGWRRVAMLTAMNIRPFAALGFLAPASSSSLVR